MVEHFELTARAFRRTCRLAPTCWGQLNPSSFHFRMAKKHIQFTYMYYSQNAATQVVPIKYFDLEYLPIPVDQPPSFHEPQSRPWTPWALFGCPFFLDFTEISTWQQFYHSSWLAILSPEYQKTSQTNGYGSKLGTPIIGWLILN